MKATTTRPPTKEYINFMDAGFAFAQADKAAQTHPRNSNVLAYWELQGQKLMDAAVTLFGIPVSDENNNCNVATSKERQVNKNGA